MNSIEVDAPFSDSKTKKTTIKRDIQIRQTDLSNDNTLVYMDVTFTSSDDESSSLRTAITTFVTNLSMVCETLKEFGN